MAMNMSEEELGKLHRWFGVECNNRAWALSEQTERSPEEAEEMLYTAYASAYHWSKVGTEVHMARGEALLAQVHALLGHAELAVHFAERCFASVMRRESPDWEIAFAHAIRSHAAAVAGNGAVHAEHYEHARNMAERLDEEDRTIFMVTFMNIPAP